MRAEEKKLLEYASEVKNKGNHERAVAEFKTVLEKFPSSEIAATMISGIYYTELNNPKSALPYAQQAVNLSPRNEKALFCLTLCFFELDNIEKMHPEIKRYISEDGKIDLYKTLFEENGLTVEDFT